MLHELGAFLVVGRGCSHEDSSGARGRGHATRSQDSMCDQSRPGPGREQEATRAIGARGRVDRADILRNMERACDRRQPRLFASMLVVACALSGACASSAARSGDPGPADEWIASEVWRALGADTGVDTTSVSVVARKGVVTIRGTMTSLDELRRALRLASRIRGVRQVVNHVRVIGGPGFRGA